MPTYTNNTLPWKIILKHKIYGTTLTYYKSTTDFLSFTDDWEETHVQAVQGQRGVGSNRRFSL